MTQQFIIEYATGMYDSYQEFVLPVEFESKQDFEDKRAIAQEVRRTAFDRYQTLNDQLREYRQSGATKFPDFDVADVEQQVRALLWSTGTLRIGKYDLPWHLDGVIDEDKFEIDIFTLEEWIAARAPVVKHKRS